MLKKLVVLILCILNNYVFLTSIMAQLELARLVDETLALDQLHGGLLDAATRGLLERMERVLSRPVDEAKTLQLLNIVRGLRGRLDLKVAEQERKHAAEMTESLVHSSSGVQVSVSGSFVAVPDGGAIAGAAV